MRLDLACGKTPKEGFIGVDLVGSVVTVNLFDVPWPWQNESVDEIYCSHFVEHVPDLVSFMNECYRILKPGGTMEIAHPYQHNNRAWQDPTHVRALNEMSWAYYDAEWREANKLDHYAIATDFEVTDLEYVLAPEFAGQRDTPAMRQKMRYSVNVIDDLVVTLRKRV